MVLMKDIVNYWN